MQITKCNGCGTMEMARFSGTFWRAPLGWYVSLIRGKGELHACSEACMKAIREEHPGRPWILVDKKRVKGYNRQARRRRIAEIHKRRKHEGEGARDS